MTFTNLKIISLAFSFPSLHNYPPSKPSHVLLKLLASISLLITGLLLFVDTDLCVCMHTCIFHTVKMSWRSEVLEQWRCLSYAVLMVVRPDKARGAHDYCHISSIFLQIWKLGCMRWLCCTQAWLFLCLWCYYFYHAIADYGGTRGIPDNVRQGPCNPVWLGSQAQVVGYSAVASGLAARLLAHCCG